MVKYVALRRKAQGRSVDFANETAFERRYDIPQLDDRIFRFHFRRRKAQDASEIKRCCTSQSPWCSPDC